MRKDTGGPAFPIEGTATPYAPGMTLRDWFAGQALAHQYTQHDEDPKRAADWAYAIADAMIAEQSKRE